MLNGKSCDDLLSLFSVLVCYCLHIVYLAVWFLFRCSIYGVWSYNSSVAVILRTIQTIHLAFQR